jgi:hypothetical protein
MIIRLTKSDSSGKTLSMIQYAAKYRNQEIYSNYPNIGKPLNFESILESVKQPLQRDWRIEKLMRGIK